LKKREIKSIAEKNRIVEKILNAFSERDGFILCSHENPDEDCIASMVAMGLLLGKLSKRVFLLAGHNIHENYRYMLNICRYNSIEIAENSTDLPDMEEISTIIILDTPKPSMILERKSIKPYLDNSKILKIEIDHHLEADSEYSGDNGYNLVTEASSTAELIGFLSFKLQKRTDLMQKFEITNLFTRNFVLSVLTGIIGDSKMGRYLKSNRERWFYGVFSSLFDSMLVRETFSGSSNFSNMEEVYRELARLSDEEEACYRYMIERKRKASFIHYTLLNRQDSRHLTEIFSKDTIITMARAIADKLAEESGYLSLVCYYDDPLWSDFVQFRMRRSHLYRDFDLRKILSLFNITNGGGHPGAIGFRKEKGEIKDIEKFVEEIISGTEKLLAGDVPEALDFKP